MKVILAVIISIIFTHSVSAKLQLSVYTGRDIVFDTYAINKIDHALYAANGKEWFIDNVLFSDYGKIYIFFAPDNFMAVASPNHTYSSKQAIKIEYIEGIRKAMDYLATHNEILYLKNSGSMEYSSENVCDNFLENFYCYNYRFLFFYPEWKEEARFGKLNNKNCTRIISMLYTNDLSLNAFGRSYEEGNLISVYEDSCRKRGVKPIFNSPHPYRKRTQYFSDADIDFFLECRFGNLDFYMTKLPSTQNYVHACDYSPTKLNSGTFQVLKTEILSSGDSKVKLRNNYLRLALYPAESGPSGMIKSISKICKALYEANGREWFVNNLLFSPRKESSLYFPMDGLFCYRTDYIPDKEFVTGLMRAIDDLSKKNDTLYASINGWKTPYSLTDKAVEKWIERNRANYILDDAWTAEIKSCSHEFQYKYLEQLKMESFAFENLKIWPHFDNGTIEGRIFRNEYEKDCKEKNLKIISEKKIESCADYSDEDINLFIDWIMKACDYYIDLPVPTTIRTLNTKYSVGQEDERRLTIRDTYRQ